jgi:hypothetical protein
MKKLPFLLIILAVLFSSCFEPENVPILMFDGEANMTIADFQKYHELSGTNPITLIEDDIIITGVITSTDQYGSCYKEIFIQDKTGGVSLRINNSSYYKKYRIGQQIFVKAKGLYLGNYVSGSRYGFYQIGMYGNSNGGMEYISAKAENNHIFRHDVPKAPPAPKVIKTQSDIVTGAGGDYHTLVKLENCYFTQANGTIKYFEASGSSTTISRTINFNNGLGTVEARISAYCTFANDILPEGPLHITGILTMFGTIEQSTPQLLIRSFDDVFPIPPAKILKNYDMKTNPFSEGWTNKQVVGETAWTYSSDNVIVNPQGSETECWFVSPTFNFSGEKDVALSFSYRINTGGTSDNLQVIYTHDGTNWKPLDFTPQPGATREVSISLEENIATKPNLQIAFKYKTTTFTSMCALYNVSFKANVK